MVRGRPLISFAIPGDLSLPTGGYEYARRLLAEWEASGIAARVVPLPGSFPYPGDADLTETTKALREETFLIDGLAYGAFPEGLAAQVGPRSTVLVHHPLADEQGLDADTAARLERSERTALRHAARVVATSPATARDLTARFGVADVTVAIPGTDPAPKAALAGDPPRLLAVGTVTPRKGYGVLVDALAQCRDLGWICEIVGASDRDVAETARVRKAIAATNQSERITLGGTTTDMTSAYLSADLFVSSSLHEGYGMAVVEAMAHGLPVVTTNAGALAETAPCARLVPPGDADALAAALRPLIAQRDARIELGQQCRSFAQTLPDWAEAARIVADAMEAV